MDVNLFAKGSLYWYHNRFTKKSDYGDPTKNQDFITNRPVIIVSENRDEILSTCNVLVALCTTSPRRPGILFESYNYDRTRLIKTTCMPYQLRSVDTCFLTNFQGVVSKSLMAQIMDAIHYHDGLIDTPPKYEHCPITRKYFPIASKTEIAPSIQDLQDDEDESNEDEVALPNNTIAAVVSIKAVSPSMHVIEKPKVCDTPTREDDKEEISIKQGIQEKEEEENFTKSQIPSIPDTIPIKKLQQMKSEIKLRRNSMEAYLALNHADKLSLGTGNSIKAVGTKCNISYYTAQKVLELLKIDFQIDKKEFLEFAKQDKHKLQFLTKKQQEVFKIIHNDDIIQTSGKNKYSDNYLTNVRDRYIKQEKEASASVTA